MHDVPRLAPVCRADNSAIFHFFNKPGGSVIAYLQSSLQI